MMQVCIQYFTCLYLLTLLTESNCVQCEDYPVVIHGKINITDLGKRRPPFQLSEKVKFECEVGYGFNVHIEAQCNLVATIPTWTFQPVRGQQCKLVHCRAPQEVEFATYTGKNFTYSSNITYSCHSGYEIVGPPTRTCDEEGRWQPRYFPYCKVLTCPDLDYPKHGFVSDFSKAYNTQATYFCDFGYELLGHPHRICQLNKTWSGTEPECIVKKTINCISPGSIENGTVYNLKTEYITGDVVIFICNNRKLRVSSKCLENGEWSERPPSCSESENTDRIISNGITTPLPLNKTSTESSHDQEGFRNMSLIIGVSVGSVLLLLGILAVLIFFILKRRQKTLSKKAQPSDAVYFGELHRLEKRKRRF